MIEFIEMHRCGCINVDKKKGIEFCNVKLNWFCFEREWNIFDPE
jgi:hypothetical protein